MRAAIHRLSSMPRSPASISAITRPLACQTAATTMASITASWRTIQSNVKFGKPQPRTVDCRPSSGLSIHCQTRPVATKDIAYGYRKIVRSTPSARTRWSMNTASRKPMARQPAMNSTPNSAMFCSESTQRSLSNSRAYCFRPTKSEIGSVRELLTEIRIDHSTLPT